jgi:hypothetical protein
MTRLRDWARHFSVRRGPRSAPLAVNADARGDPDAWRVRDGSPAELAANSCEVTIELDNPPPLPGTNGENSGGTGTVMREQTVRAYAETSRLHRLRHRADRQRLLAVLRADAVESILAHPCPTPSTL